MTVTELEAWDKMCCARPDHSCCSSRCMAWRWENTHGPDNWVTMYRVPPLRVQGEQLPRDEWTGYCGLGGKP